MMKIDLAGVALTLTCVATPVVSTAQAVPSEAPHAPRVAVTHHAIHINDQPISYTATVAEDLLSDSSGKPGAYVITTAYTRDDVSDLAMRPVMFVFNGGPGASSSPLHMSALGPMHRDDDPTNRTDPTLTVNTTSPLDVVDLVFIDPVNTGFSRSFPGIDPKQWYSGKGDAVEVATVIKDWLALHHREQSPRFLCGESYGTTRAGLIVKYAPELTFDGVLLVSGGGAATGPNSRDIGQIGSMAAGAWYHHKVDRRGLTVEQFFADAMKYARGEYADALAKGAALSTDERHTVAEHLSAYIGLPVTLIEQKNLRIDDNTYMFNLLRDQGLRTGRLDTRVTSVLKPNAAGGIDDPSLGVVAPKKAGAVPTPAAVGPVSSPAVARYLVEDLKFPSTDLYYGVNFTANSKWTFGAPGGGREESTAAIMARAMTNDPSLKLFAVTGIYDLGGGDFTGFEQSGVPADRLTLRLFPGPHEVYTGDENRAAFDGDVRKFVLSAIGQTH